MAETEANAALVILDGMSTLVDRYVPRFELYFAKPEPFEEPGAGPLEILEPPEATFQEVERLNGLVFRASSASPVPGGNAGAASAGTGSVPTLTQLLPLAGPWGDKPEEHTDDILSVQFTETIEKNALASLQIEVLNVYDSERRTYRYTDIPADLPPERTGVFPLLDYGDTLALRVGYGEGLDWMFDGVVEKFEVDFPADGESKISLTAVDRRSLLRNKKKLKKGASGGSSEEQVAAQIVREVGLRVAAEEGQLTKPTKETKKPKPKDQDALQYLTDRANKAAIELICFGKTVYVLKPADQNPGTVVRYVYRQGLISFKPTFNGVGKPTKVRVEARNPDTGETITAEVSTDDLVEAGLALPAADGTPTDKVKKSGQAGERVEVVTNYPARTQEEAKRIAIGILKKNLDNTLTAQGSILGDPRVRPRTTIQIEGVGRFDGLWYVTQAVHKLGANGYQTQFNARRTAALPERGEAASSASTTNLDSPETAGGAT